MRRGRETKRNTRWNTPTTSQRQRVVWRVAKSVYILRVEKTLLYKSFMIRFFIYLNFFQTHRGWCVHASERTRTLDNTIFYPLRARRCNRDRFAYTPRVCATRKDRAPRRMRGRRKTIVSCTRLKWRWQNVCNFDVFRFQTVGRKDIGKRKYKSTSTTRRVLETTSIVFEADNRFSSRAKFVFRTIGLRRSLRINCRQTMMFTNGKLTDNSSKRMREYLSTSMKHPHGRKIFES